MKHKRLITVLQNNSYSNLLERNWKNTINPKFQIRSRHYPFQLHCPYMQFVYHQSILGYFSLSFCHPATYLLSFCLINTVLIRNIFFQFTKLQWKSCIRSSAMSQCALFTIPLLMNSKKIFHGFQFKMDFLRFGYFRRVPMQFKIANCIIRN